MKHIIGFLAIALAWTATAEADSTAFGARVGGYGFRRDAGDTRSNWDECRMNGIGVFVDRRLKGPVRVELGLDGYFSESFPFAKTDGAAPIDRISGLFTAAVGVRAQATGRLAGFVHVGTGIELTHVSVPYQDGRISDTRAMPIGFLGVGGDIRVGSATFLGTSLRAHAMGNFSYDAEQLSMQPGWTSPPSANEIFDPEVDVAAQVQFYVRRSL